MRARVMEWRAGLQWLAFLVSLAGSCIGVFRQLSELKQLASIQ